ncbi:MULTISPECIES: rhomboid family intramembrane serine protease [unclassified Paenibacillus]|uniref:rhomboid family intramembrane serine protease n=1 Tax=unclassified Paenibacillus TaxID=185978 RepID=UPI00030B2C36|nr:MULTISPECIES: rhomboid family intramembrane serine protease [unclassified Paenibacillus]MCM3340383.1 rhomboid family intramembrane serine protease [Paenibacillus sp. MER TA 81-3]
MIFIRYENWRSYVKNYPVTTLLIIANLVMFAVLAVSGGSQNGENLFRFGAIWKEEPYIHETWRMATAMFLHSGFEHLLFNMFALFVFAPPLEKILGSFKYALLYVASGLLGNGAALMLSEWGTLAVGASGAIYGLYGAYLFIAIFQRWTLDDASRKTLLIILGIGIAQSFIISGISWSAHIGGLVAGFAVYSILRLIR